jgi:L-alanine-DL-glutamate epimerase-like enolase superfamily enzyme
VTIPLDLPGAMAETARTRMTEGFDVLKLKVGGGSAAEDVDRIVAVHGATAGAAALRLDANQAWSARQAVEVMAALHDRGVRVEVLEQPVAAGDLRAMRWVRDRVGCPVMADESVVTPQDVLRVIDAEAADLVNVKIAKHGGIRAAQQVIAVAAAGGLPCVVGSMMEPPSTLAASVALAATLPWPSAHDLDAALWLAPDTFPAGTTRLDYAPPDVRVCPTVTGA